jgi:trehalose/maltose hydrolase-like predicted phosphorylase
LVFDGYDAGAERTRETLCTLGNGYLATRGAASEAVPGPDSYPGTYVAGCYNRLSDVVEGRRIENESIVNLPNWLLLRIAVGDGDFYTPAVDDTRAYQQELDLRHGVLHRRLTFTDRHGRDTALAEQRLVHMKEPHLAATLTTIEPVNWSGDLRVRSDIDGAVENAGVDRYRPFSGRHLSVRRRADDGDVHLLEVETVQSRIRIVVATRVRVRVNGRLATTEPKAVRSGDAVARERVLPVEPGDTVTVEKVAAIYTSRDRAITEPGHAAVAALQDAGDFADLLDTHARAWHHLWRRSGAITADADAQSAVDALTLRLHQFHLLQTLSLNCLDSDVGVPARGLHGEAYRGHVFWDELFVLPALNACFPEITRALLLYRYRRLPAARRAARAAGCQGAMYPWQSGSDGREESQQVHLNPLSGRWMPDVSSLQRHVGLAVAFTVWQYVESTGDEDFLAAYGAEILIEVSRFFACIAGRDLTTDRFMIRGVMGPDEFHTGYPTAPERGIDNNAYTNVMVVWLLRRVLTLPERLPLRWRELTADLVVTEAEIARWREITRSMFVPFHDGVISQFQGYERLERLDLDVCAERWGSIARLDRLLEADGRSVNDYQVSKQADALMLFYLLSSEELERILTDLGYGFEPGVIARTVDYYLHRTSHGSSLSAVVHACVLARTRPEQALALFRTVLSSDLDDSRQSTTAEGVHLGSMAASLTMLQRSFAGVEQRDDVLWVNPAWPRALVTMGFQVWYRGAPVDVVISDSSVTVTSRAADGRRVRVGRGDRIVPRLPGVPVELTAG